MDDKQLKQLTDRLDTIARLLTLSLPKEITQNQKMKVLSDMGLQPKEIASIIGTTPNTVRVELSKMKKTKSRRKIRNK